MTTRDRVEKIRISPCRYDVTGYAPCKEEDAEMFSVSYLGTEPSYGKGWFPAYDKDMKHRYISRAIAEMKANEFKDRHGLRDLEANNGGA
jgi:hypothetical protein